MVKTKVVLLLSLLVSYSAIAQDYTWSSAPMDGSRTGCTAVLGNDIEGALGTVKGDKYVSPSGKEYSKSTSVYKVASVVLDAQPTMQKVKEIVAHSEQEMIRVKWECPLSNWFTELIMDCVEGYSGKEVQVGICNFGGIRSGMPEGDVILDDILSMFPFKNTLVYLELKGSELKKIFSTMAETTFQAIAGVEILAEDGKLVYAKIDGKPIEDDRYYGVATISFLLYGGDSLYLAENSSNMNVYQVTVAEAVLAKLAEMKKEGKSIVAPDVKYVTIK